MDAIDRLLWPLAAEGLQEIVDFHSVSGGTKVSGRKGKSKGSEHAATGQDPESPPDPLKQAVPQFHGRIDGLRELLEIISPQVAALDLDEQGLGRLIDEGGFSEKGIAVMKGVFGGETGSAGDSNGGQNAESSTEDHSDSAKASTLREEQALAFGEVVTSERDAFQGFLRRLVRGVVAPREDLLNSSLLTLAVATFENLLTLLATEHLRKYPGALESEDKAFSLADLQGLGSIEDARTVLIERRVDGFMRKGIDDWSRWAEKTLGASFSDLCINESVVKEIFQRRHLIVHAGGVVNRMYLERAPLPDGEPPELGKGLMTSGEYVTKALDEFEVLGDLLLFTAWSKWRDGPDRAVGHSEFEDRILELMAARRWEMVRRLCERGAQLNLTASGELVFRVNHWIAIRHLDKFDDEYRNAVRAWDTSALAIPFVMAKAVLLDEEDRALELLEWGLTSEQISRRDAETWPLLAELRDNPKFNSVLEGALARVASLKPPKEKGSSRKASARKRRNQGASAGPKKSPSTPKTSKKQRPAVKKVVQRKSKSRKRAGASASEARDGRAS